MSIELLRRLLVELCRVACVPSEELDNVAFGKSQVLLQNELHENLETARSTMIHRKRMAALKVRLGLLPHFFVIIIYLIIQ